MITASGSSSSSMPAASLCAGSGAGTAFTGSAPEGPGRSARDAEGVARAEKSWSWVSRLMARRPELDSRSVRVLIWSASRLEKKRLAAVLTRMSVSPTETIALASTRTLIGRGVPFSSTSAVWSVMSRSTLITLLEIVVPMVRSGISFDLPGPR
jgi:hypothetical protein